MQCLEKIDVLWILLQLRDSLRANRCRLPPTLQTVLFGALLTPSNQSAAAVSTIRMRSVMM
jgi:hypothetical protein